MKKGYIPAEIQADILNNYFSYIASTGYMDDARTSQLLTGVLLLDTIEFFADYIDKDYIEKIEKYLRKSRCCNCAIRFDKIITSQCKICPPSPEPTPTTKYKVILEHIASGTAYPANLEYIGDGVALHSYLQKSTSIWNTKQFVTHFSSVPDTVEVVEHSSGIIDKTKFVVATEGHPYFFVFGTKESPISCPTVAGANLNISIIGLDCEIPAVGTKISTPEMLGVNQVLTMYQPYKDSAHVAFAIKEVIV